MRFLSRDKGTATKGSSASGKGNEVAEPKFEFESQDHSDENDMDRRLVRENLRSMAHAMIQHEGIPATRYENEDAKANEAFQGVPGYHEGLRSKSQKKQPTPYAYPPGDFMRGPTRPTPRVEGDDPAADQLFAGATRRQESSQTEATEVSGAKGDEESHFGKLAREARRLGMLGSNRKKGEDPAADELFQNSKRP